MKNISIEKSITLFNVFKNTANSYVILKSLIQIFINRKHKIICSFCHYKRYTNFAHLSVLNCNNFGSNKGIVIKLTVMFRFVFEAPTAGLPSVYYISRNDHGVWTLWRGRVVSGPSV